MSTTATVAAVAPDEQRRLPLFRFQLPGRRSHVSAVGEKSPHQSARQQNQHAQQNETKKENHKLQTRSFNYNSTQPPALKTFPSTHRNKFSTTSPGLYYTTVRSLLVVRFPSGYSVVLLLISCCLPLEKHWSLPCDRRLEIWRIANAGITTTLPTGGSARTVWKQRAQRKKVTRLSPDPGHLRPQLPQLDFQRLRIRAHKKKPHTP